ncbi:MAG TPA: alpha/beta-type small acid-soluble spore protein [Clostridia bacterium]|nr:alpha/beta-type small acid-soluble spore protein [Clostridiales bacterium]HOL92599.1 alpha/beta-type small acid-soluble spore protein [Clostridiales bacterium]
MANNTSRSNSRTSFDQLKYEIASQVGVNLKQGYNGDISARDAGKIGGNIVKKVFESYTGSNYDINKK